MAAEELVVVLSKRNDSGGLGFSLLGLAGLPHIVYDIGEHTAAAESGQVEAGDIILRVNDTDVSRLTTKEVLKCLRLSKDPVRLTLKRDPVMKARVLCHMTSPHSQEADEMCDLISSSSSSTTSSSSHSARSSKIPRPRHSSKHNNGSAIPTKTQSCPVTSPVLKERNGSDSRRTSSTSDKAADKNEMEWEPLGGPAEKADKSGPPRFEAYMMTGDLILNLSRTQQSSLLPKHHKKVDSLLLRQHHNYHNHQHHNSVPTSPNECDMGMRAHKLASSPTCNSAGASPVGPSKHDMFQEASNATSGAGKNLAYHHSVRTSRSEDQLQKDCSMSAVDIDIDEDVTSSLNTLLDTRPDSGPGSRPESQPEVNPDSRLGNSHLGAHSDIHTDTHLESHPLSFQETGAEYSPDSEGFNREFRPICKGDCHGDCPGDCQWKRRSQFAQSQAESDGDSGSGAAPRSTSELIQTYGDRIVWTYNAPEWWIRLHGDRMPTSVEELEQCRREMSSSSSGSEGTHEGVGSPTSVSSSVMSSNSSNFDRPPGNPTPHHNGDLSQSEAISNISSPDFQEEETMDILSARDLLMEGSDPSDSDSTLMANTPRETDSMHRIVIEVKGPDKDGSPQRGKNSRQQAYQELRESEDGSDKAISPPLSSEDESDIESLHSYHYSPKGVDIPSAVRLAKRLYTLDGFKKSDISKHLSKNNDFSRAVAEEYLKHFNFTTDTLDTALRKFLKQFSLAGETQERERVLVHFSKRYLDCNPGSFNSQDAVHTLTCALMLLNTDLHAQNIGRKMTCSEFIDNLAELNDGENFPRDVLKLLYQAIKCYPLEWALDVEGDECGVDLQAKQQQQAGQQAGLAGLGILGGLGANPFLDVPNAASAIEYKKGYVMRKCCIDPNGKKTPFGKRSWRMYYCTLRDLVLYLHKDEHGFRKSQLSDNLHNAIRIHHALASKATDYTKKQHVFRLQTADQAEYLFQTSDSKELQSWIDTINFVCASFSAQPLASGVGSQRKFQRPLLPCSHTKLNLREQLRDHEERVLRLEAELEELRRALPERGNKGLNMHSYKEKDAYLHYELKRYKTYAYLLRSRMSQYPELVEPPLEENRLAEAITEEESSSSPPNKRYSYRAAIYNSSLTGRSSVDSYAAELG